MALKLKPKLNLKFILKKSLKIFDCIFPETVSYIFLFIIVICINYYLKHKIITPVDMLWDAKHTVG